jgi:hypothetical protein
MSHAPVPVSLDSLKVEQLRSISTLGFTMRAGEA